MFDSSFHTRLEEGAIVFLSQLNSERSVSHFDTAGGASRTSVRTLQCKNSVIERAPLATSAASRTYVLTYRSSERPC
jgi:hypothetical protein